MGRKYFKIAQIAEQAGVAAITIHGRTREDFIQVRHAMS